MSQLHKRDVERVTPADLAAGNQELAGLLDELDGAANYAAWIHELIEPHLGSNVVEIGAGHQTFTQRMATFGGVKGICVVSVLALFLVGVVGCGSPRKQGALPPSSTTTSLPFVTSPPASSIVSPTTSVPSSAETSSSISTRSPSTGKPASLTAEARADALGACDKWIVTASSQIQTSADEAEAAALGRQAARLDRAWNVLANAMTSFSHLPETGVTPAQNAEGERLWSTITASCATLGVSVPRY